MEPEGSLQHSQVPATCPHREQIDPVHTPTYYFLEIHLNIILPFTCVSQVVSFLQVSPPKHCIRLSSPPYKLHAHPILLFSILSTAKYWVKGTDH